MTLSATALPSAGPAESFPTTPVIRGAAIVTGGGQGLGRAFCHAYAKRGVPVAVVDIDAAQAAAVAGEITAGGRRALAVQADVTVPAELAAMVAVVEEEFGPPGVLVNNAALFATLAMRGFEEIELAEWEAVLRVNVTGVFLACQAVVPAMRRVGYGKIVNVSSATVWTGRPNYLHYVTSKAALIGLTRSLASEVGPHGITVNAITPGSTATEVPRETITDEMRAAMAAQTALRRGQLPTDLLGAVLFLSSSDSDFITGQTLNVDGGFAFH